jgi:protein gp37
VHIDWFIVGCESGPRRRHCETDWVRDIVRQCREAGTACFVKQLQVGPRRIVVTDPALFPEDLRVREMPEVQTCA